MNRNVRVEVCVGGTWVSRLNMTTNAPLNSWLGGQVGFNASGGNVGIRGPIELKTGYDGTNWATSEFTDSFAATATSFTHDLAGNMTADGLRQYVYDAWNRLVAVKTAAVDPVTGDLAAGTFVVASSYDGLGRRIKKVVTNSGDRNGTYHFYYDGQGPVEVRNGSNQVLQQYVWGLEYVDELLQVGVNQDPADSTENNCERFFWVCQDANYNVIGLLQQSGRLLERYEYTPYGERQVFSRPFYLSDLDGDGVPGGAGDQALLTAAESSGAHDSPADLNGDAVVDSADQAIMNSDLAYYSGLVPSWDAGDSMVSYPEGTPKRKNQLRKNSVLSGKNTERDRQ